MKRKITLWIGLILLLALGATTSAFAFRRTGLNRVRLATVKYLSVRRAQADGYDLVPGLDYCFDNPGVGGMGYHYINTAILDTSLDPLHPEAMVYGSARGGRLRLGAVEYIVPADAWAAEGNTHPPEILGRHLHLNEALGVYVLHAWIWKANPAGVFEDWNPRVSCP